MNAFAERGERRREERRTVAWQGRLLRAEGAEPCEIKNISCNGVHISSAATLEIGSEAALEIDHLGSFSGTVVWGDGDQFGIRFPSFSSIVWQFLGCSTTFEDMSARAGFGRPNSPDETPPKP